MDAAPADEENVGDLIPQSDLDQILSDTSSRYPSNLLATTPQKGDSEAVQKMRSKLAHMSHLARREIVKMMLLDGYEPWQVKNEFLTRPDLFTRFIVPLKNPDLRLDEDMNVIRAAGLLRPLAHYIEGLKRSLRRANTFADNSELSAKERSSWAKSADDVQRNLAILEKAIHVVPGRGDLPLGEFTNPDDGGEDAGSLSRYSLPNVEPEDTSAEDEEYGDHD